MTLLTAIAAGLGSSVPAYADDVDLVVNPSPLPPFVEGQASSVLTAIFTDADDPSATAGSFTATINWGDGTTSTGTITANGPGFLVTGTHTYADELTATTTTTITQNSDGSTVFTMSTANVVEAETLTGLTFAASPGTTFSGTVASFTDLNPFNTVSDFTALINWGDGTESSATIVSNGGSSFLIDGTHIYTGPGRFTVTSGLTLDGGGDTDSVTSMADVGGVTSTPEPSSALLLGAGFGLLMLMARRRLAERLA